MYTQETDVQEFLEEYLRSRFASEGSVRAVLKRAVENEHIYKKEFYKFTQEEILEMFKKTGAISVVTLQNNNLVLKHASRWFADKNGLPLDNEYENITKDLLLECVNADKRDSMMLTREQLTEIQDEIVNWTDKCILELLWLGVGGKALRELTYLIPDQVSLKNSCIYFKTGKIIPIDDRVYAMLQRCFNETELMSYSIDDPKINIVRSVGVYKLRNNVLSQNIDPNNEDDVNRRYRWVQRRIDLMKTFLDINMTSGSVQDAGLLHLIREGMKKEGVEFNEYLKTNECKKLAQRYDIYSELFPQILRSKFGTLI